MELSEAQFRAQFSLSRPIVAPTLRLIPSIVPAPNPSASIRDSPLKSLFEPRAVPPTIRDNGIQMDREIQNPVYECKTTAHPLNPFAT